MNNLASSEHKTRWNIEYSRTGEKWFPWYSGIDSYDKILEELLGIINDVNVVHKFRVIKTETKTLEVQTAIL